MKGDIPYVYLMKSTFNITTKFVLERKLKSKENKKECKVSLSEILRTFTNKNEVNEGSRANEREIYADIFK